MDEAKLTRIIHATSGDDVLDQPTLTFDRPVFPVTDDMIVATFKDGAKLTLFVDGMTPEGAVVSTQVTPWARLSPKLRRKDGSVHQLIWEDTHLDLLKEWVSRGQALGEN